VEAMLLQRRSSLFSHERRAGTDLSRSGRGLRMVSAPAVALFAAARKVEGRP